MNRKILIGNISPETSEEVLRAVLAKIVGSVTTLAIPQNAKTRKNRGYAIAEFPGASGASRAVNLLDGYILDGRALSVSLEQPVYPKRKWYEFGEK